MGFISVIRIWGNEVARLAFAVAANMDRHPRAGIFAVSIKLLTNRTFSRARLLVIDPMPPSLVG